MVRHADDVWSNPGLVAVAHAFPVDRVDSLRSFSQSPVTVSGIRPGTFGRRCRGRLAQGKILRDYALDAA